MNYGEWIVTEKPGVWVGPVVRTVDNRGIAFIVLHENAVANARLIASAPGLLFALRECRAALRGLSSESALSACRLADEALGDL
jgi:hypothetical protein